MKTLIKTLDVVIDNDNILGMNELRVYVPETLSISYTGFKITMTSAQTFRVIGGYFTNSASENLGTTKKVPANTETQVILKATSEDCYLIIPDRFKINSLNLSNGGINNAPCALKFFEDGLDFINVKFSVLSVTNSSNGQLHTEYLYTSADSLYLNAGNAKNFLVGDIANINGSISQFSVSGDGIYGELDSLKLTLSTNLIYIVGAPNISGTVESIGNKLTQSVTTYARTCNIYSNGVITYNDEAVPKGKIARISIAANSDTYTVKIS